MVLNQAWSLLLVSLAAALLPGLSRSLRLPAIVLEILFGVVLGESLLQIQFSGDWISFLAELGFLLLMFQAGMEIDFFALRRQSGRNILFHLALFGATLGLSVLSAFLLDRGLFVALILMTTSLGLVVPTLKETGISRTPHGQALLIAATIADFLTLFGITFFLLYHEYGLGWRFLGPVPLFLGFGFLLKLGRLWAWWHPEAAGRLLSDRDDQELGVRLSLALLFLFVALSELVHIEPVLGAFLGGAVLSVVFREKGYLEAKLSGIGYGFLIPIFFIHVGMQFDLGNVLSPERILFTLALFGFAVGVKLIPALLFLLLGTGLRKALNAGILLSSRLSLIIVAASIGLEAGFVSVEFKDAIVLLAVITCLSGPTGFKLLHRPDAKPGKAEKRPDNDRWVGWMRE